jgi:hypothetical protein
MGLLPEALGRQGPQARADPVPETHRPPRLGIS